ncbi:hypothetical protein PanWU01x14_158780, partial [Parasponia andersonii]
MVGRPFLPESGIASFYSKGHNDPGVCDSESRKLEGRRQHVLRGKSAVKRAWMMDGIMLYGESHMSNGQ